MKLIWILLVAGVLGMGAAWAQVCPTGSGAADISAATSSEAASPLCPLTQPVNVCPAQATLTPTGDPRILVLGTQERATLRDLHARHVNWRDVPSSYNSLFSQSNPMTSWRANPIATRHGNPYAPYYQLEAPVRVAGSEESFATTGGTTMTAENRHVLRMVEEKFHGITPEQATLLGYQPVKGGCLAGYGTVYLNTALVDNTFDPMNPEALTFNANCHVASVQYVMLADQPFCAFGQQMQASPLVTNGQQLGVWLYEKNPNGEFSMTNPRICAVATSTTPATERPKSAPRHRSPTVTCRKR